MDLAGKTAIVTGGASGLGEAVAVRFLAEGASVGIIDRSPANTEALMEATAKGNAFIAIQADVAEEGPVEDALARIASVIGPPSICVCCAGIGGMFPTATPEGAHPLSEFRRLIEVNLIGVFNVARLAAAAMIRNAPDHETGERGVIVNTSSMAATDGRFGTAAYSAAKAGVVGMTLPMARDLSAYGIRVMTIAPGLFDTPLLAGLPDELMQMFIDTVEHPKRAGRPEEFARLVQHIVQNPYLNAETIRIDGGTRG